MTKKVKALDLAERLDAEIRRTVELDMLHHNAAAELRRLHMVNQELLNALRHSEAVFQDIGLLSSAGHASAAIAKAEVK